jgi:membrane protein
MTAMLGSAVAVFTETLGEWYEDRAPRLGAALAYYMVFALAPGLIFIISVAALVLGEEQARSQIIDEVRNLVGSNTAEALQATIESVRREGGGLLPTTLGIVTLLFGLWGVFGELQDALNTIWGVTAKPGRGVLVILKERFWSFTMVVGVGFLLLVSLALSAWIAAMGAFVGGTLSAPTALLETINNVFSTVVIALMFAMIFKLLPDVTVAWRNVWPGAAVTALLFTAGKSLIGLYLGRTAVGSAYGAAGSLVVILIWIYYSAQILFFGAEFTKVYTRRAGTRVAPEEPAVPMPDVARAKLGMDRSERVTRAQRRQRRAGRRPKRS